MNIDSLSVQTIDHKHQDLSAYRGKVLLIVNVASKCGFTGQYAGLQKLHEDYAARGLVVMGFPCDQFGHQEPGDDESILSFCQRTYNVTFPMFAKIDVNGPSADPLFQWLKTSKPGLLGTEGIKWNFTKFLVSRSGEVVGRFAPTDSPESLSGDIEAALNTPV